MEDETEQSASADLAELVKAGEESISPGSQPETETKETEEVVTPSQEESKAEDKQPEDPAQTKELPFHKHPRWIRQQEEKAELLARIEAMEAKQTKEQPVTPPEQATVPPEFQKLFGEDVEAYKSWQAMLRTEARKEAEGIISERTKAEEAKRTAAETLKQGAVSWAEDQFIELTDELGIDLTDPANSVRNRVLDICLKGKMFDAQERPNIRGAYEILMDLSPQKTDEVLEEKKRVVAKTNAKSNAAPKEDTVLTSSKLKKMSINQFFK